MAHKTTNYNLQPPAAIPTSPEAPRARAVSAFASSSRIAAVTATTGTVVSAAAAAAFDRHQAPSLPSNPAELSSNRATALASSSVVFVYSSSSACPSAPLASAPAKVAKASSHLRVQGTPMRCDDDDDNKQPSAIATPLPAAAAAAPEEVPDKHLDGETLYKLGCERFDAQNFSAARRFFEAAIKKYWGPLFFYYQALYRLGDMHRLGLGGPKDDVKALKYFLEADKTGVSLISWRIEDKLLIEEILSNIRYELGKMYFLGLGGGKNDFSARKFFYCSSLPLAQYEYGCMCIFGIGGLKNEAEALRSIRQAAEAGIPQAQFDLGILYTQGKLVAQDPVEARKWIKAAADQGYNKAQYQLGYMHLHGIGGPQNPLLAKTQFIASLQPDDPSRIKTLLETPIDLSFSLHELGVIYEFHELDLSTAVSFYRLAASKGLKIARQELVRLRIVFPPYLSRDV